MCLQDTTPDELLSAVMTAVLQDVGLRPEVLGDICVGEWSPSDSRTGPRGARGCCGGRKVLMHGGVMLVKLTRP